MKKLLLFILTLGVISITQAQTNKTYTSLEEALEKPAQVIKLELAHYNFEKFPQQLFRFTNLEELTLTYCSIKSLPKEITRFKKLKGLFLYDNYLENLPEEIGQLKTLESISLYSNKLPTLPTSFGQLKRLKFLDLGDNRFTRFPAVLFKLPQLKSVSLYRNQLRKLPTRLRKWKQGKMIDVRKNPLNLKTQKFVKASPEFTSIARPMPPPPPHLPTKETGRKMARKDFKKGILKLSFLGYPSDYEWLSAYLKALQKRGIDAKHEGSVVESWMEGYNEFMREKIEAKLGKDIWQKCNIEADIVTNYHIPRLPDVYFYGSTDVISFTNYLRPLLKKVVTKPHQHKMLRFTITVDAQLKTKKVEITQGVSPKIDQECVKALQNIVWKKPRSLMYLKQYKQVVFKGKARLYYK